MSIFLDQTTRVIVQGFTGRIGTFHAQEMIDYGTNVVGGVTPGKGGERHLERPVFNTVKDAVRETGAEASIVFVPPPFAADAITLQAGRAHDPDRAQLRRHHQPRQGDDGHHAGAYLYAGQRRADRPFRHPRLRGRAFRDHLERFEQDPDTLLVVMIGEIGGPQEAEAAAYAREHMKKPVLAYIAGLTAPRGRTMGHAGAIVTSAGESAAEKVEILREAGIGIILRPSEFGSAVAETLK
jgi:succinyl-CoA synthetase alpha subunit